MPQGRNIPSFCAADTTDETVWNDKEHYDDGIDYDDDNEDDDDNVAIKKFCQSYMPPLGTPLYTKLTSIQKEMTRGPMRMSYWHSNFLEPCVLSWHRPCWHVG
jgi:hypothetical protein